MFLYNSKAKTRRKARNEHVISLKRVNFFLLHWNESTFMMWSASYEMGIAKTKIPIHISKRAPKKTLNKKFVEAKNRKIKIREEKGLREIDFQAEFSILKRKGKRIGSISDKNFIRLGLVNRNSTLGVMTLSCSWLLLFVGVGALDFRGVREFWESWRGRAEWSGGDDWNRGTRERREEWEGH